MTTIARVILVAVLACASGCARPDWIQDTLVTVDVTGTWVRSEGALIELKLEQQGAKVTGSMLWRGGGVTASGALSGAVEGTVAGDVFRFRQTSGTNLAVNGEMTVSGDEMTGYMVSLAAGRTPTLLRRVNSPAPPRSQ